MGWCLEGGGSGRSVSGVNQVFNPLTFIQVQGDEACGGGESYLKREGNKVSGRQSRGGGALPP